MWCQDQLTTVAELRRRVTPPTSSGSAAGEIPDVPSTVSTLGAIESQMVASIVEHQGEGDGACRVRTSTALAINLADALRLIGSAAIFGVTAPCVAVEIENTETAIVVVTPLPAGFDQVTAVQESKSILASRTALAAIQPLV